MQLSSLEWRALHGNTRESGRPSAPSKSNNRKVQESPIIKSRENRDLLEEPICPMKEYPP